MNAGPRKGQSARRPVRWPSSASCAARRVAASPGRTWPTRSRSAGFVTTNALDDAGQEERPLLLEHLARDHEALHLVRALVDLRDLRVPHHALDGVLLDEAVAAEDLDRLGRHVHRNVGAV